MYFKRSLPLPQVKLSTRPPEPVIPAKKPFKVELVGGKRYSWLPVGTAGSSLSAMEATKPNPRPIPATLRPRERHLVVWMQAHKQPALLQRYAQAGLHCVCSATRTSRVLRVEGCVFPVSVFISDSTFMTKTLLQSH